MPSSPQGSPGTGRLGGSRNLYRVTLLQTRPEERIRDIQLSIDLSHLLSLSDRTFLMEFRLEEVDGREMGALTFDGELPYALIRRLETAVERQTGVHPIGSSSTARRSPQGRSSSSSWPGGSSTGGSQSRAAINYHLYYI